MTGPLIIATCTEFSVLILARYVEERQRGSTRPPPWPSAPCASAGGELALAALRPFGVDTLFTLSGGHVFPFYDAAVKRTPLTRIVDVRHEQTATFAAEGLARLTRRPGLAVLTAGPGVTNGVSAIVQARFNGSPVVVLGGRAPQARWGSGSLQEFDHVPLLAPVTKVARTVTPVEDIPAVVHDAAVTALTPHRGPVFVDFPIDVVFAEGTAEVPPARRRRPPPSPIPTWWPRWPA